MTRLLVDAKRATVCATDEGKPTVPGDGTPNPSLEAGWVTMPVAALPSGKTTRIASPTGTPLGMSSGTDHQPSGSCSVGDSTDLVIGSPWAMSVVADAPARSGAAIDPSGSDLHSTRFSVITVPADTAKAAKGNGSL